MTRDSTEDVDEIWDAFEAWLSRNHPQQLAALNPPASEGQLRSLEAELPFSLAPDLRHSLLRHNGATDATLRRFPADQVLMSVDDIVGTVQMHKEIAAENDFEGWWSDSYVPIASAGNGDHHCIDLNPTSSDRTVFEWYHDDLDGPALASSFTTWLRQAVDAYLRTWDLTEMDPFAGHSQDLGDLDWSGDNAHILTVGDYCAARIWDAGSGRAIADIDDVPSRTFVARFSPDGQRFAVAGSYLRVFETATPELSSVPLPTRTHWYSTSIGWLPDGERIVALVRQALEVWDATAGKLLATLPLSQDVVSGTSTLALSSSEARAAIISRSGMAVISFDGKTPRIQQAKRSEPQYLHGAALDWAPDSEQLAASNPWNLQIFDSRTLRAIATLPVPESASNRLVQWAPDGRHLATGGDRCRIWSVADREQTTELQSDSPVTALAWAPDSGRLSVGYSSGALRLWAQDDAP